ncbi:MAG: CRISPR-associated endonuclease Cas2 [Candidatus Gracilibacteria bacterium]|nr:CRISPR-associated endonuclease Cas2 [Candidatus Gracilibacteria bacterium]
MLIVSYDISNDKVRTKFAKFLKKFGRKIQYSVYEIKNSPRIINNITIEIEKTYKNKFSNADSILIVPITEADEHKIIRYGYPALEEEELLFL